MTSRSHESSNVAHNENAPHEEIDTPGKIKSSHSKWQTWNEHSPPPFTKNKEISTCHLLSWKLTNGGSNENIIQVRKIESKFPEERISWKGTIVYIDWQMNTWQRKSRNCPSAQKEKERKKGKTASFWTRDWNFFARTLHAATTWKRSATWKSHVIKCKADLKRLYLGL